MSSTPDTHKGDCVASTSPAALFHRQVLSTNSLPHASDRRSLEFDELAVPYPADREPSRRPRSAARDTLAVDAGLDRRAVDADGLEVLDDQIDQIAAAEIRRVEAPQFAHTHFSAVVDGYPGPVVEDA